MHPDRPARRSARRAAPDDRRRPLLLGVAALGQAIPDYAAILVARLVFGVAFGALLTAGVAWLSQEAGAGGSARLGATVTSTSVGTIVGPAIGGLLGQGVGLGAPFVAAGAAPRARRGSRC